MNVNPECELLWPTNLYQKRFLDIQNRMPVSPSKTDGAANKYREKSD